MNTYSYDSAMLEDSIGSGILTFVAVYMIFLLVVLVAKLVLYILKGVGMYKLAKRQKVEYPWLAFIPFARYYLQGEVSDDIRLKNKSIKNPGIWLIVLPIAWNILFGISYVMIFGAMFGLTMGLSGPHMNISGGALGAMVIWIILFVLISILYQAVYKGLKLLVDYQIYGRITTNNMALVHAILGIFIPCYEAICLFVMSRKPFHPEFEEYFNRPVPKYDPAQGYQDFQEIPPMTASPQQPEEQGEEMPVQEPVVPGGEVPVQEPEVISVSSDVPIQTTEQSGTDEAVQEPSQAVVEAEPTESYEFHEDQKSE
ncbi:MAG: hypothetical protein PHN80_01485 [Hespellia sp.]|nr:hypothetical protein [Hespellia sp.]